MATMTFPSFKGLSDYQNKVSTVELGASSAILSSKEITHSGARQLKIFANAGKLFRGLSILIDDGESVSWLEPSLRQMGRLLLLAPDWDFEGAPAIDITAIKVALNALISFMAPNSISPQWTPTKSGGLQLDWHQNGVDLEICFEPNNKEGRVLFSDQEGEEWDGSINETISRLRSIMSTRLNG